MTPEEAVALAERLNATAPPGVRYVAMRPADLDTSTLFEDARRRVTPCYVRREGNATDVGDTLPDE